MWLENEIIEKIKMPSYTGLAIFPDKVCDFEHVASTT
jgi:hypothetical protein